MELPDPNGAGDQRSRNHQMELFSAKIAYVSTGEIEPGSTDHESIAVSHSTPL